MRGRIVTFEIEVVTENIFNNVVLSYVSYVQDYAINCKFSRKSDLRKGGVYLLLNKVGTFHVSGTYRKPNRAKPISCTMYLSVHEDFTQFHSMRTAISRDLFAGVCSSHLTVVWINDWWNRAIEPFCENDSK